MVINNRVGTLHPLQRWLSRGFLSVFSMVILLGVMAAGYYATLTPVTIVVDGQARTVRTNQRAVDNILREAGHQDRSR